MSFSRLSRRDILRGGASAATLGALSACSGSRAVPGSSTDRARPTPARPKRILILGGTGFLGPKTVAAALARGHRVTIFNRGKREKIQPLEVTGEVEHRYGNRDPELPADDERGPDGKLLHPDGRPKGLEQLAIGEWDAVIDNSGFYPRMVAASAKLLAPRAGRYIYISSISAYRDNPANGGDETTALAELADPTVESMGAEYENYGGLKVLCERAVQAVYGERAVIIRPGFIVGPGDPTDRFTYWPARVAAGGEVLAPGAASDPVQWIDVRDLAEWLIELVERGTAGTFNAIGPARPARWGEVLDACVAAAPQANAKLVWVPNEWLTKHGIEEGVLPIWVAPEGKSAGFHRWSNARAIAAGLRLRLVADTVTALLTWWPGERERRIRVTKELAAAGKPVPADPGALRAGPSRDRERELLTAWRGDH